MEKNWILSSVVLTALIQGLSCQNFLVEPSHAVASVGESARFNCTIQPSLVPTDNLEWHLRGGPNNLNVRLYSTVYPNDIATGYQIDKDEATGRYDIVVDSVATTQAGSFECEIGRTQEKKVANLIVSKPVVCSQEPSNNVITVGLDAWLLCRVESLGVVEPSMNWVSTISGVITPQSSKQENAGAFQAFTQIGNITASSEMDDSMARCEVTYQGIPNYLDHCERTIMVEHPVDTVVIMPMVEDGAQISVGSVLNCSANGRPLPTVYWRNMGDGTYVYQEQLDVTGDMVGSTQRWQCIASNEISGTTFQKDANITFSAVGGGDTQQVSGAEGWQIAVGIVVPLVIIILVAAVVGFIFYRRKQQAASGGGGGGQPEKPRQAPEVQGIPPDTRYAEENQAYASSMGDINKKPPAPYNGHPQVQMNPDPNAKFEPGQVSRHSSAGNVSQASIGQEQPDIMGVMGQSYGHMNKPLPRGPPPSQPPRQYYDNTPDVQFPPDPHGGQRGGGTDV